MDTPTSVWAYVEERQQPALVVKVTRSGAHILYLREGYGVDTAIVPEALTLTRPLMFRGEPYPLKRHLRHIKRLAKAGITKRAEALLAEL